MGADTKSVPTRAQWLRRLAAIRRERTAFVLSGGGPLGALQVGALRALFERGIRPDFIVGASVGALNGAFVAFDPGPKGIDRLEDVWLHAAGQNMFPGGRFRSSWARMFVRGDRVFENSGIRRLVETRLGDARFEDAQIPLTMVATDLETGRERLFTSGPLLEPLLASTAMPGVFPPVAVDGRMYIDGGIADNVPIAPAVRLGVTTVYVIDSTAINHRHRPLNRPIDYLLHAFSLARSQRFAVDLELLSTRARIVVLPTVHLDFFVSFSTLAHTERLIRASYERTMSYLGGDITGDPDPGARAAGPAR